MMISKSIANCSKLLNQIRPSEKLNWHNLYHKVKIGLQHVSPRTLTIWLGLQESVCRGWKSPLEKFTDTAMDMNQDCAGMTFDH